MSEQAERYAYSRLTDTWYLVSEWDWHDRDNGQMIAKSKTEVDRSQVPDEIVDATDEVRDE